MFSSTIASAIILIAVQCASAYNFSSPALPPLGRCATYGVLAYSTITNSGATVVNGDLGLFPGSAVTGFPLGIVMGLKQVSTPLAELAQGDLGIAFSDLASRAPDAIISGDLGGLTLTPGVYVTASTIAITGILYLDAEWRTDAAWIFQIGTTVDFEVGSSVVMLNMPTVNLTSNHQNVFWQVGTTARIKTASSVVGTVLAWQAVAVGLGAVTGPLWAKNAAVTLLGNSVTARVLPGDYNDDSVEAVALKFNLRSRHAVSGSASLFNWLSSFVTAKKR
jgi:hypothetical protein